MIKKIIALILGFNLLLNCCGFLTKVPDTFEDSNKLIWNKIESQIINTPDQDIYLYWKGFGGEVDLMVKFITVLSMSKLTGKVIHFVLIGDSYSAHAMSVCYADSIDNKNKFFIMFHLAQTSLGVDTSKEGIEEITSLSSPCVQKGIMLPIELNHLQHDYEVYIFPNYPHSTTYYLYDRRQFHAFS